MYITRKASDPDVKDLVAHFTVKNKNIERKESMLRRSLPYERVIKLYHFDKDTATYFFPFSYAKNKYLPSKKLPVPLIYTGDDTAVPEEMRREQDELLMAMSMDWLHNGLLVMKTGRGKWNVIVKMVELLQQKTIILCPSIKLVLEMQQRFKKFSNYIPGVYYWQKKEMGKDILITTHASFVAMYKQFAGTYGVVLYDECDTNITADMIRALCHIDAEWIFGFTGTPKRQDLDSSDLSRIFGPIYKSSSVTQNGYTMLPTIMCCQYHTIQHFWYENFAELKNALIKDTYRIQKQLDVITTTYSAWTWVWLLLVDRVEECYLYQKELEKRQIQCGIIHGNTKPKDDNDLIERIVKTKGIIVWTYQKIGRGVDIPVVSNIYLFFPTRFDSNVVQAVGRWLRYHEGKPFTYLYDRQDLPLLRGQATARRKVYLTEYPGATIRDYKVS